MSLLGVLRRLLFLPEIRHDELTHVLHEGENSRYALKEASKRLAKTAEKEENFQDNIEKALRMLNGSDEDHK